MLIGMLLCGVLAGFGGVLWGLIAAESVILAIVLYPLAGIAGILAFVCLAMLRSTLSRHAAVSAGYPVGQSSPAHAQSAHTA